MFHKNLIDTGFRKHNPCIRKLEYYLKDIEVLMRSMAISFEHEISNHSDLVTSTDYEFFLIVKYRKWRLKRGGWSQDQPVLSTKQNRFCFVDNLSKSVFSSWRGNMWTGRYIGWININLLYEFNFRMTKNYKYSCYLIY